MTNSKVEVTYVNVDNADAIWHNTETKYINEKGEVIKIVKFVTTK